MTVSSTANAAHRADHDPVHVRHVGLRDGAQGQPQLAGLRITRNSKSAQVSSHKAGMLIWGPGGHLCRGHVGRRHSELAAVPGGGVLGRASVGCPIIRHRHCFPLRIVVPGRGKACAAEARQELPAAGAHRQHWGAGVLYAGRQVFRGPAERPTISNEARTDRTLQGSHEIAGLFTRAESPRRAICCRRGSRLPRRSQPYRRAGTATRR